MSTFGLYFRQNWVSDPDRNKLNFYNPLILSFLEKLGSWDGGVI
jgi:hypothetical protein